MLLARRNLFRDRTRFLLSVLGVAVSIGPFGTWSRWPPIPCAR